MYEILRDKSEQTSNVRTYNEPQCAKGSLLQHVATAATWWIYICLHIYIYISYRSGMFSVRHINLKISQVF